MDIQNMKPVHLLSEELSYELRIRGIVTTRKDASIKRKMLQKCISKEVGRDLEYSDPEYNFENEQKIINEVLDNLRNLISEFSGPETDSGFLRIRSRLIHVTNRVKRIKFRVDDDDESIQTFKNESYATCIELEVLLGDNVVNTKQQIETNNSSNLIVSNNPVEIQHTIQNVTKSVPVYKWDITKFNGDYRTLFSFLVKVDELCKSRHVTRTELFQSASDLFSDKAYVWYKSIENTVTDWDSLVALIKKRFLVVKDFDDIIWDEIRTRTQGKHEPIHIYIAVMETYFTYLERPVHECTKLKWIRKLMLPHYLTRMPLSPINTISELIDICQKIDEDKFVENKYHPPPKTSNLNPDLVYLSSCEPSTSTSNMSINTVEISDNSEELNKKGKTNFKKNQNKNKSNKFSKSNKSNDKSAKTCWNCNLPNHTYHFCTARKNRFCHNCGKPNETVYSCKNCSKN